jgi:hypothetical protein
VSDCDSEALVMRRPRTNRGCRTLKKKIVTLEWTRILGIVHWESLLFLFNDGHFHSLFKLFDNYWQYEYMHSVDRDSDSLRAGRSRDLIPMWAVFSAHVQTGPGVHPASHTVGTGSLLGDSAGLITQHLAPKLNKE